MPQLVSVLSSWDPVSANAFSAGELHGQILEYDYISPDYEDVCHSCFSFSAYSDCASCATAVHSIGRTYERVVAAGSLPSLRTVQ